MSPAIYGVERALYCGVSCKKRDEMEGTILRKAIKKDKAFVDGCKI